jgi:hypothetical protein
MSKNKGTLSWKSASGVGALSTMSIAIIQSGVLELTSQEITLYTTIAPIISTAVVTLSIWLLAFSGFKTTSQLVAEKQVDNHIVFLKNEIDQNKKAENDTSELQKQLTKAYISKSKLSEKLVDEIISSE